MAIYFDNSATSFPKPAAVVQAVTDALQSGAGNPGRGAHGSSLAAGRLVLAAREAVAGLFGVSDPARIVFTANATEALNLALFGLLEPGDRVVTTTMEHNAVTRPLRALQDRGVTVTKVPGGADGFVAPERLKAACAEDPRMLVMTHCSNVTGTVQAVEEIGPWCRQRGILLLVDAAQSAGLLPLNAPACGVDLLAAPGHKGLLGPQGTGFLYLREGLCPRPLLYGGTGGNSHSDLPPDHLPERLEAGTLNTHGLAGLLAGIAFLQEEGLPAVRAREMELTGQLLEGLAGIAGVQVYGSDHRTRRGGAVSFNLAGRDPAEVGFLLEHDHDILVRVGLHCAPDAHRTIGTFPRGTVRVSPGYFSTAEEIDHLLSSVAAIVSHRPG